MKFLRDLLPIFKKHTIYLIDKKHEADNIYTFYFKSNEALKWKPGQHGIFTFPNVKLDKGSTRGFSVASVCEEENIMISTRIPKNPSAFKRALNTMKPGDRMTMRGPFGPFYISNPQKPAVFIAGGIGIPPFRSLIQAAVQNRENQPVSMDLIYIDTKQGFAYKDYFDEVASNQDNIHIKFLSDRDAATNEIDAVINGYGNNADYFISGPPSMVKELKNKLIRQGIKKNNIKHEMFIGY